jgi:predicted nucleotidyltransferase
VTKAAELDNPNIAMLEIAVKALGDVRNSLVFVGGCVTDLLVTTLRARQSRPTEDIDVVAKATTIRDYHRVEAEMRKIGFKHDTSPEAPICRWLGAGVKIDVMPSGPGVLSFHNRWYPLAVETAQDFYLPSGRAIRLIAAPVFIATKIEAFRGRGNGDFLASHDLEDVITVIDGRISLIDEVRSSRHDLRAYLAGEFSVMIASAEFLDTLAGHLPGDTASQLRMPALVQRLRALAFYE